MSPGSTSQVNRFSAGRIALALLATLALLAVLFSTALARPVLAAHDVLGPAVPVVTVSPEDPHGFTFQGNNVVCPAGTTELKFESSEGDLANGTHTGSVTIGSTTVTVTMTVSGGTITTFSVTNGLAAYVFNKASASTNVYDYSGQPGGGIAHDDGLISPTGNGISHASFCLIAVTTPPPPVTGDLAINKTHGANALPGVVFTLTGASLTTPLTDTTDATGKANFDDLAPGTYTLTETTPAGFNPAGPWAVTVSATGVVTIAGLTAGTDGSFTIVNSTTPPPPPVTGDLVINKTNGATALAGVTFTLSGGGLTTPLTDVTDAAGKASFDDLAPGSYTLTETTPTGFNPAGPWTVTVSATGVVTIAGLTAGTDGSFTIVNTSGGQLGGNSPTPPPPVQSGTLTSTGVPNTAVSTDAPGSVMALLAAIAILSSVGAHTLLRLQSKPRER